MDFNFTKRLEVDVQKTATTDNLVQPRPRYERRHEQIVMVLTFCAMVNHRSTRSYSILGDPGVVSGGRKSLNGREKNSGEEKSRTRIRAPGDKVLTDQFQTVGVILASDWCQKIFVFFCPITEQQD